ncbi:MAG: 50S ribosomal protein L14 [Candidatus Micrarchaeota archaeon]|nr:50S ribosomal protein L14 [Candidatus Micrarchaeota archaeon]MCX8154692.1 50S ribosomal protein L14 [Candidatus Micrarchaeota archaeon]
MKSLRARITKSLGVGSYLKCDDNSGARELMIIGVVGYKGVRSRVPKAGVGDMVICSVKRGDPKMVGTIVKAVIVRQRKEYRRYAGYRVMFEDNAAVVVNEDGVPVGTEIKGIVAREAVERYPKIAAISQGVV